MNLTYEQMFKNVDISTYENCKAGDKILFNNHIYTVGLRNNNSDLHIITWDATRKTNKSYSIHNLIWCFYNNTVTIPENKRIIFLDHNKHNVHWKNLRLVSDIMTENEFRDIDLKYKYFDDIQVINCKLGDRIFVYDRTYVVVDISNGRCKNSKGIILIYNKEEKQKYVRLSTSGLLDSYYEYMYYTNVIKRIS